MGREERIQMTMAELRDSLSDFETVLANDHI
jgi:hypothetical protein